MTKQALQKALGELWTIVDAQEVLDDNSAPYLCLYYPSIGSTSDEAERLPSQLFKNRKAVALVAKHQTAGHGRCGRVWHAPSGSALTFTVLFPISAPRPLGHWPLLAGWSQLRAYASWVPHQHLDLKWPNDVLIDGKKVSGVLCSMQKHQGQDWLCLGIGANIGAMEFPEELQASATSLITHLAPSQPAPTIPSVLAALLECLEQDIYHLPSPDLLQQFEHKSSLGKNTMISYIENNQTHTGQTLGLDKTGALLCQTPNGIKALMVSEVSRVRKN